jgi:hypothetical protein
MSKINLYINNKNVNGKTLPKYEHKLLLGRSKAQAAQKSKEIVKPEVLVLGSYSRFIYALSQELNLKINAFNVAFTNCVSHSTVLDMPYYMRKEIGRCNILIEIRTEADEAKEEAFYNRIISEHPGQMDIQYFI